MSKKAKYKVGDKVSVDFIISAEDGGGRKEVIGTIENLYLNLRSNKYYYRVSNIDYWCDENEIMSVL